MVIHNPFSKIPLYWQVTLFIKNKMFLTLAKRLRAVRPLPSRQGGKVDAAHVSVGGQGPVLGLAQVQVSDDRSGPEVEMGAQQLHDFLVPDLPRAECVDVKGNRLGHADGVGYLNLTLVGDPRSHDVLRGVARHVGAAAVDLGGVLAGESPQ